LFDLTSLQDSAHKKEYNKMKQLALKIHIKIISIHN